MLWCYPTHSGYYYNAPNNEREVAGAVPNAGRSGVTRGRGATRALCDDALTLALPAPRAIAASSASRAHTASSASTRLAVDEEWPVMARLTTTSGATWRHELSVGCMYARAERPSGAKLVGAPLPESSGRHTLPSGAGGVAVGSAGGAADTRPVSSGRRRSGTERRGGRGGRSRRRTPAAAACGPSAVVASHSPHEPTAQEALSWWALWERARV
jgi:hypothetical protein